MGTTFLNMKQVAFSQVSNQQIPEGEGPRTIPLLLDFTAFQTYVIDASQIEASLRFSMVQTVYIDLSTTDNPVLITVQTSGQLIRVKGRTQGYYPIMSPNPSKLAVTYNPDVAGGLAPGGSVPIPLFLLNFPVAGVQWATQ